VRRAEIVCIASGVNYCIIRRIDGKAAGGHCIGGVLFSRVLYRDTSAIMSTLYLLYTANKCKEYDPNFV
jgi:hypothetical protein